MTSERRTCYGFHDRVYLVTGVSRRAGIGAAVARRLIDEGASLVVQSWEPYDAEQPWGADPDGVGTLIDDLRDPSRDRQRVEHISMDFAHADAPAEVMRYAVEQFGHVDGIVVNHASGIEGRLADCTAESLDRAFAVNVRAAILLTKEFAAQHDNRLGGRVVLFTSGQHLGGMPSEVPYATSKGALQQVTATLAAELTPRGITVNCVNPGPTDTAWADAATRTLVAELMPQQRWGQPDDAARLVAWLLSDEAEWICGQTINSEGGFKR